MRLFQLRRFSAQPAPRWRTYTTGSADKPKSAHAQWYADIVPAMIPIALLGSAVYLGLQFAQLTLSHEKYMEEARERVRELETEIEALQEKHKSQSREPTFNVADLPTTRNTKSSRWWWFK